MCLLNELHSHVELDLKKQELHLYLKVILKVLFYQLLYLFNDEPSIVFLTEIEVNLCDKHLSLYPISIIGGLSITDKLSQFLLCFQPVTTSIEHFSFEKANVNLTFIMLAVDVQ